MYVVSSAKVSGSRAGGFLVLLLACTLAPGCGPSRSESSIPANKVSSTPAAPAATFVGSKSCRECHEHFHELWAASRHGLAMQPYTPALAARELSTPANEVAIGKRTFRADLDPRQGAVVERSPAGEKSYPIAHVLGGKNAYYFLAPLDRGRLQVLPIAYDVQKKTWYDTAASGVRHFPDRHDEALDWTDRLFTFNTTCFNCHVSQLANNYDLKTDTYHTTWAEPGISCESCHGPASEHVRAMEQGTPTGHSSKDIKIIRTKEFTAAQMNDMCATCHAKMVPMSTSFLPSDRFFDHFDLVTLDHPDYYPDGRDLGENYTFTSWLMSPCAESGKLDCNHCHTASGRPRFEGADTNQSCMPCHSGQVNEPVAHSHHATGSAGNQCIACHMPRTRFAAMGRTDHSMRSPTPATTLAFQSPNACNLCHADKKADWADEWVRKWYKDDYQAPMLHKARLLDAARKGQWRELPAMLAELTRPTTDEVWKTSLVRLLHGAGDASKEPVIRQLLKDPSPLVRSSAATVMGERLSVESLPVLLAATRDPSRLVRIRAAQSLAAVPAEAIKDSRDRASLETAVAEFQTAMSARPDDWASHANLGNFAMERGSMREAVTDFEIAARLEPRMVGPMVNASLAYSNLGEPDGAEACLRRALKVEPENPSVNFNLGLLLGEQERFAEAEQVLRRALKADPQMAAAAYNLGVILGRTNVAEAVQWCQKAHQLQPDDPKYAHSLAFYQRQSGDSTAALVTLTRWLEGHPTDGEASLLLGQVHEERGDREAAETAYHVALGAAGLPEDQRAALTQALHRLQSGAPRKRPDGGLR